MGVKHVIIDSVTRENWRNQEVYSSSTEKVPHFLSIWMYSIIHGIYYINQDDLVTDCNGKRKHKNGMKQNKSDVSAPLHINHGIPYSNFEIFDFAIIVSNNVHESNQFKIYFHIIENMQLYNKYYCRVRMKQVLVVARKKWHSFNKNNDKCRKIRYNEC